MQRQLTFGGGWVSPRNTRLRGQGAIEYVLVIAIIVLVVMIAGPWVSSAIRNQFNTVAGVLVNGTLLNSIICVSSHESVEQLPKERPMQDCTGLTSDQI